MGRPPALLALTAAIAAWSLVAHHLAPLGQWPTIAVVGCALMPATFALVWIALPLWDNRWLPGLAAIAIACAAALTEWGPGLAADLAKVAAMTLCGWFFLTLFEELTWVLAVALIIPWVDAYSVWRGPTRVITSHGHAATFAALSVAFVVPSGATAAIGLPDLMFFALFLAASVRFGLRTRATWIGMTLMCGGTVALTTVWSVNGGLPALPGIALGFLVPNADLIRRQVARRGQPTVEFGEG